MEQRYEIRHSYYLPYAEVLTIGGGDLDCGMEKTKQTVVVRNLSFSEANKRLGELGFGYSIHPQ